MKKQEIIKSVVKLGNSACVLLPRAWVDGKAKVELIEKPLDIKRDLFEILTPYLEDIIGVYLVGSYARGEETAESDVDVLVISKNLKEEFVQGKYHISIYSIESVKKTLKKNPIMIYPRLLEAKTILNKDLLEKLKSIDCAKMKINEFLLDTKRIIKINKEFIELDKLDGRFIESDSVVYSIVLRLRAIFLIKNMLSKEIASNKEFKKWLAKSTQHKEDIEKILEAYKFYRDKKKQKTKIKISLAEELLDVLKKEIEKYGK